MEETVTIALQLSITQEVQLGFVPALVHKHSTRGSKEHHVAACCHA